MKGIRTSPSYLLIYKIFSIVVGAMIIGTTSIGLGAEPAQDFEASIIDARWKIGQSEAGDAVITSAYVNVRNDAYTFRNYSICAQVNSDLAFSDVACEETGTLSPRGMEGDTKKDLIINLSEQLSVADVVGISFGGFMIET